MQMIDINKLMQVRQNDANLFTNFRLELEKQFRELRLIKDETELKLKVENIFHESNDVQGQKIRQKLDHIEKQSAINVTLALALGILATSVTSGGLSLAGLAVSVAKGYKDYIKNVKKNPTFFLWKAGDK